MRIEQLNLIAYGAFQNVTLDLSTDSTPFHLIYGPNEAGKSTCLRAIDALLFGIPTRTTDGFLCGNAKLRIGATLAGDDNAQLSLVRRKNGKSKLYDSEDATPIDPLRLEQILHGIDQATFRSRFGLSYDDLVAGGKAVLDSKGDLGEILFAAGVGVGKLTSIRNAIDEDSRALFLESGKKPEINELLKAVQDHRKRLNESQTAPSAYKSLMERRGQLESEVQNVSDKLLEMNARLRKIQAYREAREVLPLWARAKETVDKLKSVPLLTPDFGDRRWEAISQRDSHRQILADLDEVLRRLESQRAQIDIDRKLIDLEPVIKDAYRDAGAREAALKDKSHLEQIAHSLDKKILEQLKELDVPVDDRASVGDMDRWVDGLKLTDEKCQRIHELISQSEKLRERERIAQQQLDSLHWQIEEIDDELEQAPEIGDPSFIDAVLNDIGTPANLIAPLEQQQRTCDELESHCLELLRQLSLDHLELPNAVALKLPSPEQIDAFDERYAEISSQIAAHQNDLERLKQESREITGRLEQIQTAVEVPSESELQQQRTTRNQMLRSIEENANDRETLRSKVSELENAIRLSDLLVDTIRAHHETSERRKAIRIELNKCREETEQTETRLENSETQLRAELERWESLWKECGVEPESAKAMRRWMAIQRELIEKHRQLERSRQQLRVANEQISRAKTRLVSVMERAKALIPVGVATHDSGSEPTDSLSLDSIYDATISMKKEIQLATQRVQRLRENRETHKANLPSTKSEIQQCKDRLLLWQREWSDLTENVESLQSENSSHVLNRIHAITKLFETKRERDILRSRIRSIDHDYERFCTHVQRLSSQIRSPLPESDSPIQIIEWIHDKLSEEIIRSNESVRIDAELADKRKNRDAAKQRLRAADAQLNELCREANVSSVDDLADVARTTVEKQQAMERLDGLEERLALIAEGAPLESFAEEARQCDPNRLDQDIESLSTSIAQLDEQRIQVHEQLGGINKELASIDGGERAADLRQSMQFLIGNLKTAVEEYAKLKIGGLMLQRAIDHYRSENESPVLTIASEAFRDLTCGRYSELRPDFDDRGKSHLFGVLSEASATNDIVPVEQMSLGTRDAVYFALRLASLEHQLTGGKRFPIVIDDCLIQFDDARAEAALKRFSQLAKRTQVILFTHHEHLVDLAVQSLPEGGVQIHRL